MNKTKLIGYQCMHCRKDYKQKPFLYHCPACGNNLDIIYNYEWIRNRWSKDELTQNRDQSLWRYLPLLPVQTSPKNLTLQVGGTALISANSTQNNYRNINLYFKDDTHLPSGSLKDRATELAIQHAGELGKATLVAASTGNAAASLSTLAAFYCKQAVILAPASAPIAKLTQILQCGADLYLVDGSYDQAFELSLQIVEEYGWYLRSTGVNPILSEGKKTVAIELAEQLDWEVPDKIFIPVGDGCIIGGVYKGFFDLYQLGWIRQIPKIIAVQAKGSSAVVDALESGTGIHPVEASTIADSIAVDEPRDSLKALRAVKDSDGFGITVSDEEILDAQKAMSEMIGLFAEPAAAASFAGFLKAVETDIMNSGETVVILVTGSGLKDITSAQKRIEIPRAIEPTVASFRELYDRN